MYLCSTYLWYTSRTCKFSPHGLAPGSNETPSQVGIQSPGPEHNCEPVLEQRFAASAKLEFDLEVEIIVDSEQQRLGAGEERNSADQILSSVPTFNTSHWFRLLL